MKHIKKFLFTTFCLPLALLGVLSAGTDGEAAPAKEAEKQDEKPESKSTEKDGPASADDALSMTQDELDALIEKRLARERHKWEREHPGTKKTGEEQKDQKKDDTAAGDGGAAKIAAANHRLVQSEAKAVALTLGVKPERTAYAVRMADLSHVDVNDELGADGEAIKKAMEQVLKDIPELKGSRTDDRKTPGFHIGGDGDGSGRDKDGKKAGMSYRDAIAAYYKK